MGVQLAKADVQFQNSLLKMDVNKTAIGGVRITFYTNKPYQDNIFVNPKSDTEYTILLPETSNSMTADPILNAVSDVVKAIQVKTQQYDGQTAGYTKITIYTNKPIEIRPQVETLSTSEYKLSENDYKELMAQPKISAGVKPSAKKHTTKPAVSLKTARKLTPQTLPNKLAAGQSAAPKRFKIQTPALAHKIARRINHVPTAVNQVHQAYKQRAVANRPIQPKTAPVETKPIQKIATVPATVPSALTTPTAPPAAPPVAQTAPTVPGTATAPTTPVVQTNQPAQTQTSGILPNLETYKNILINNIYTALGLLLAVFILLLIAARKMSKNVHKQKEIFTGHLKEKPVEPTDYSEKISEDMDWKEKFQAYNQVNGETNGEVAGQTLTQEIFEENQELSPELSNLFGENISQEILEEELLEDAQAAEEEIETKVEAEWGVEGTYNEIAENVSVDELFSGEEEETTEESETPEAYYEEKFGFQDYIPESLEETPEEDEQLVKSEFQIDENRGFYLVDFEDTSALIGHIADEIFVLKRFEEKVDDRIQARLNEKKGNNASYMAKIGSFKAIVEVTPEDMNLLIEL